jgi:hypothetical protein
LTANIGDPNWENDVGALIGSLVPLGIVELYLDFNQISGVWSSGWLFDQYPKLQKLSVSNNFIFGELPSDIWEIMNRGFNHLDVSNNLFEGSIPEGIPKTSMHLDFSNNPHLKGGIPMFLKPSKSMFVDVKRNFIYPSFEASDSMQSISALIDPSYYGFGHFANINNHISKSY